MGWIVRAREVVFYLLTKTLLTTFFFSRKWRKITRWDPRPDLAEGFCDVTWLPYPGDLGVCLVTRAWRGI